MHPFWLFLGTVSASTGISLLAQRPRSSVPFWAGAALLVGSGALWSAGWRRREAGRVAESYARLAAIVEFSADAIISNDINGEVNSWNPAAERLYGYTEAEAIGQPISFIAPLDRPDELDTLRAHCLAGQQIKNFETIHMRKDGEPIDVSITMAAIRSADGEVIGNSILARDVRERKRTLSSLARLAQDLSRSNAELEQFAYIASHDLQEPLRMVASYTQLLARRYQGRLDADADEFIQYAVDGATRMQALINGLLEYSRVGTRAAAIAPAALNKVLEAALHNLQHTLEEAGATVTHDPLPTVPCDASQIIQLFQNLIANAVKFRREEPPCIHVGVLLQDHTWTFSVSDNGVGIDPIYVDRVFDIFERLHSRDEYPGTGIGLAVCKRIVERHGGRIWVESEPGKGSTFFFTLFVRDGGSP